MQDTSQQQVECLRLFASTLNMEQIKAILGIYENKNPFGDLMSYRYL